MPVRLRVLWLLRGDRRSASSRLQGYLIHDELRKKHSDIIESKLILAPPVWLYGESWDGALCKKLAEGATGSIVVMQKLIGQEFAQLPRLIRAAGGKTVYVHCDYDPDNLIPFDCDAVVVTSRVLADWYIGHGHGVVKIIEDPNEFAWEAPAPTREQTTRLIIGWIGHEMNWGTLDIVRQVLVEPEFADFQLVTISNHPDATLRWSPEIVKQTLREIDIGVIPVGRGIAAEAKSSNRATMFMGAGVPTIAGRIPAYEDLIRDGENGFLVGSAEDMRRSLRRLRSRRLREDMGRAGLCDVQQRFTVDASAEKWIHLFRELGQRLTPQTNSARTALAEAEFENAIAMRKLSWQTGNCALARKYAVSAVHTAMLHPNRKRIIRVCKAALYNVYRRMIKTKL